MTSIHWICIYLPILKLIAMSMFVDLCIAWVLKKKKLRFKAIIGVWNALVQTIDSHLAKKKNTHWSTAPYFIFFQSVMLPVSRDWPHFRGTHFYLRSNNLPFAYNKYVTNWNNCLPFCRRPLWCEVFFFDKWKTDRKITITRSLALGLRRFEFVKLWLKALKWCMNAAQNDRLICVDGGEKYGRL